MISARDVFAGLFGVFLSITAVELALHAIEMSPAWRVLPVVETEPGWPDPDTGYALRPGRAIINVREQRARVTTNSAGMRDRERTVDKPPGTLRLAVTGDSFVEALQVADDATFTRLAEKQLNPNGTSPVFEVLNFGMSGAGPVQQLAIAAVRALAFSPDAIIMMVNARQLNGAAMTDDRVHPAYVPDGDGGYSIGRTYRARRSHRYRDTFAGRVFFLLMDHSRIARAVYLYYVKRGNPASPPARARPGSGSVPSCAQALAQLGRLRAPLSAAPATAVLETWLRDVAALADPNGPRLVILLSGLGSPREQCPAAARRRGEFLGWLRERAPADLTFVDADAVMARISATGEGAETLTGFARTLGSGHLNESGHRAYAALLAHVAREVLTAPPARQGTAADSAMP